MTSTDKLREEAENKAAHLREEILRVHLISAEARVKELEAGLAELVRERDEAKAEAERLISINSGLCHDFNTLLVEESRTSDKLAATRKLLAEAVAALGDASEAISESLRYIDGNPPHQHLPNLDWLAAVDRRTRSILTRIKEATNDK